jgi:glucosamine-6-phosphate deaminase
MKIKVMETAVELGEEAALLAAAVLNRTIANRGQARLVLSTGASQFETLKALVGLDVDWKKVAMFHLDEYVGLPESHPASFRRYLKERFVNLVHPGRVYFVNGEGDITANIMALAAEISKEPPDLALVGVGENSHIAFNDPPADFTTKEPYIVVNLNDRCKRQQVREGWFATAADVPRQAVSMSVYQIMQCKTIIAPVPHREKAEAIRMMLEEEVTNEIPATILTYHPALTLLLDRASASKVNPGIVARFSQ